MRIAYVAPYQGPALARRRPILGNMSLGGRTKIALLASLLRSRAHDVEILSQGEVVERALRYYPAFVEPELDSAAYRVRYASAMPVRFLNAAWSSMSTVRLFKERHRAAAYDLVLLYNLKPPQVAAARHAIDTLGLPVVLEYEDDQFLEIAAPAGSRLTANIHLNRARQLLSSLSGCLAGSVDLLSQAPPAVPRLLLPGVVGDAIVKAGSRPSGMRLNRVVFSGTHSSFQGLEQLVTAWRMLGLPGWELHIAGDGSVTESARRIAGGVPEIVFHGVLDYERNAELLASSKLTVVPYEVSKTRGFSFKTVECLAAGLHVLTTRLTALDSLHPELKGAITYLDDNAPPTIARAIGEVIRERRYETIATASAIEHYGPVAASRQLDRFLDEVMSHHAAIAGR